ncbi:DUF1440 domain-containing protein [Sphingomonas xinjiangensis]|uniref:DUF1440 domain-containing protein n=1 Tax=Sphingomonas xinjiangensis TaxID=643568 RepID=A0A840YEC8_9SPHN|nr:DUF1440 domain-containing protein [Sphingomonas xinjiangensis]MBB5711797.1 hypothetical protein [Sphingomonas xinjiangensis]
MNVPHEQNARKISPLATGLAGAAAGAAAVWLMDRADWFMWNREDEATRARTLSVRPGGEAPAGVLAATAEQHIGARTTNRQHKWAEVAVHYAIGVGPAAVYSLTRDKLPVSGATRGLLYGFGLFLLQDEALNAVTGLSAKPQRYPRQAHARGLVAHLVYGVATEVSLNFMQKALSGSDSRSA